MFKIPQQLINAIIVYLETKPFREVNGLIIEIQKTCTPIVEDKIEPAKAEVLPKKDEQTQ